MKSHPMLLLSGLPGTGKSYFGRWLAANTSFIHYDLENDSHFTPTGPFYDPFRELLLSHKPASLVRILDRLNRPVALDWGFPPEWLDGVQAMKDAGFRIWWFDADRVVARDAFIRRASVPVELFDLQVTKIEALWEDIKEVFGPNILTVLEADGTRMAPEEIFRTIMGGSIS